VAGLPQYPDDWASKFADLERRINDLAAAAQTRVPFTGGTLTGDLTVGGTLTAGSLSAGAITATGSLSIGNDLTVTDDASVGGDLAVTGNLTLGGDATLYRRAAGIVGTLAEIWAEHTNFFDGAWLTIVTGDSVPRLNIETGGAMSWGPGNAARDTFLHRTGVGILATDAEFDVGGNLKLTTAGGGLYVKEGTNATMGAATLVAGTVTVNTTKASANSRIFLTGQGAGGTVGFLRVSARVNGTSFTILSSSATDTRSVAWLIAEPA
jgi:hypothetical protein